MKVEIYYLHHHELCGVSHLLTLEMSDKHLFEDDGGWLLNFVGWLKLNKNTVGYQISGLVVKCSRARLIGLGFESREVVSWMRIAEESHKG